MKKRITLTESDLHKIIKKYVKKALTEGSTSNEVYNKWETIKETVGCDKMIDDIWNYLDDRAIDNLIDCFNQDYDLFDNGYEEDDPIL